MLPLPRLLSEKKRPELQSVRPISGEKDVEGARSAEITSLLEAWGRGDTTALDRLTPLVYEHLRMQARRYMRYERAGVTLQGTALVHEAYLRLVEAREIDWRDRSHFYAVASQIMRRILVDAARARTAGKRGGDMGRAAIDIDAIAAADTRTAADICALNEALDALARIDARRARVVELRFFGGLTVEETAEILRVSPQSVMRDWRLAKAWLMRELRRSAG
jgi:RNA polymerase sigma factor (TIGR02999 family)